MDLLRFIAAVRQRTFPAAFRIDSHDVRAWGEGLAQILAQVTRLQEELSRQPQTSPPAMEPKTAVGLCNELFQIRRNVVAAEQTKGSCKELRRIQEALGDIDGLLKAVGVEYFDLSGQEWDPGRNDFESLGKAQEVPGLVRHKILLCERPAVRIGGKIVQRAKGVVGRPPASGGAQPTTPPREKPAGQAPLSEGLTDTSKAHTEGDQHV